MIQALAALMLAAGVAGLYLAWRDRRAPAARRRLMVAASWLLLAAGLAVWSIGRDAGVAIATAVTLTMVLGLGAIGLHALPLRRSGASPRNGAALEPPMRAANIANRAARLAGSLVVAPLLGLAAGLLWFAWMPGAQADRLMGEAFAALLTAAIALMLLLASRRPVRTVLIQAASALVMAGAVLPALPH